LTSYIIVLNNLNHIQVTQKPALDIKKLEIFMLFFVLYFIIIIYFISYLLYRFVLRKNSKNKYYNLFIHGKNLLWLFLSRTYLCSVLLSLMAVYILYVYGPRQSNATFIDSNPLVYVFRFNPNSILFRSSMYDTIFCPSY